MAIMARQSAYTGKALTWEQILNSKEDLTPPSYRWDKKCPSPPWPSRGKRSSFNRSSIVLGLKLSLKYAILTRAVRIRPCQERGQCVEARD